MTVYQATLRLALGTNLLLPLLAILLLTVQVYSDWCPFRACENTGDFIIYVVFAIWQLMWLAIAWLARLLGRSGAVWLGYGLLLMMPLMNLFLLSIDTEYHPLAMTAFALLLAAPLLQLVWLLVRSWRKIADMNGANPMALG